MSGFPTFVRRVLTVLFAALVTVLTVQLPAGAATPRPVGPPWVSNSSPTSLTLAWTPASGAKRYEVFVGTSYTQVKKTKTVKKTSGTQRSLRITGLKPGRMYCFQVRAVNGSKVGSKSQRHCKMTMRKANNTKAPQLKVATYNVCSNAGDCARTWRWRVNHVVDSIKRADADVIGIQELNINPGRDQLEPLLTRLGYQRAVWKSSKAIYYRASKVQMAVVDYGDSCYKVRRYSGPTEGWPTEELAFHQFEGRTYQLHRGEWWEMTCEKVVKERFGNISLDGAGDQDNKWAVYADFQLKGRSPVYRFVNAHLITGNTRTAEAKRWRETTRLFKALDAVNQGRDRRVAMTRTIIVGDLNSHRNRKNDTPRSVLEKRGFFDAYDRSSTYSLPNFNSANQWKTKPVKSNKYGDHVDHVFLPSTIGSTKWATVHRIKNGSYVKPLPSDHVPVRVTLFLP